MKSVMSGREKVIWNSSLAQENVDDETIFEGFDIWLHCLSGWRSSQLAIAFARYSVALEE